MSRYTEDWLVGLLRARLHCRAGKTKEENMGSGSECDQYIGMFQLRSSTQGRSEGDYTEALKVLYLSSSLHVYIKIFTWDCLHKKCWLFCKEARWLDDVLTGRFLKHLTTFIIAAMESEIHFPWIDWWEHKLLLMVNLCGSRFGRKFAADNFFSDLAPPPVQLRMCSFSSRLSMCSLYFKRVLFQKHRLSYEKFLFNSGVFL